MTEHPVIDPDPDPGEVEQVDGAEPDNDQADNESAPDVDTPLPR